MPEGPEVRRHADALDAALRGKPIETLAARTKAAKAWLAAHPDAFPGQQVEKVWSHGKQLVGQVEGGLFFSSHLMMWGRWHVVAPDDEKAVTRDRRERARITAPDAVALLYSAPVFVVGEGDPYEHVPHLATLGPDILPYDGPEAFDAQAFRARLAAHPGRAIGAALLDQTVLAGVGNYLRAEILFDCRLDPWTAVEDLTGEQHACLVASITGVAAHAYAHGGRTITDAEQARMQADSALHYGEPHDWNTRHHVFRRTNLPCLTCGTPVKQLRQTTRESDDGDKTRVIYFCPACQGVDVAARRQQQKTAALDA